MTRARAVFDAVLTLGALVAIVGGIVFVSAKVFSGGDEDTGAAVASLGPPESSWLPGQAGLQSFGRFEPIWARATTLADHIRAQRERDILELERKKREARERADDEARRRYEEARRRALAKYREALRKAAEERRRQALALAKRKRDLLRMLAEREKALDVKPGEECRFRNVQKNFACRHGRLPDPEGDKLRESLED